MLTPRSGLGGIMLTLKSGLGGIMLMLKSGLNVNLFISWCIVSEIKSFW